MAHRLDHERVNRAEKVTATQRAFTPFHAPAAKLTGITCGCGLDLAHFGTRRQFTAHRDQCSPLAA